MDQFAASKPDWTISFSPVVFPILVSKSKINPAKHADHLVPSPVEPWNKLSPFLWIWLTWFRIGRRGYRGFSLYWHTTYKTHRVSALSDYFLDSVWSGWSTRSPHIHDSRKSLLTESHRHPLTDNGDLHRRDWVELGCFIRPVWSIRCYIIQYGLLYSVRSTI